MQFDIRHVVKCAHTHTRQPNAEKCGADVFVLTIVDEHKFIHEEFEFQCPHTFPATQDDANTQADVNMKMLHSFLAWHV